MLDSIMDKYRFAQFSKEEYRQLFEKAQEKFDRFHPLEKNEDTFLSLFEQMIQHHILLKLRQDKHLTILKNFFLEHVDFSNEAIEDVSLGLDQMATFLHRVHYRSNFLRMKLLLEEFTPLGKFLENVPCFHHEKVNRTQLEQISKDYNVCLLLEAYCIKKSIPIVEDRPAKVEHKFYSDDSALRQYSLDLDMIPPLSNQEIDSLLVRIKNGDVLAKQRFLEGNLRLVFAFVTKYLGKGIDPLVAIQEGNLGLMMALENYDPDMGVSFSTYASLWIKQRIHRKGRDSLQNVSCSFETDENDTDTFMTKERICSLDSFDSSNLISSSTSLDDEVLDGMMIEEIASFLDSISLFTEMEKKVIKRRYTYSHEHQPTYQELADEFGITKQRVMQLEHKALDKLRSDVRTRKFFRYHSSLPRGKVQKKGQPKRKSSYLFAYFEDMASKEVVEQAISFLSSEDQRWLSKIYGESFDQRREKFATKEDALFFNSSIVPKMKARIERVMREQEALFSQDDTVKVLVK